MASNCTFSSSAAICLYAVCAVLCPKSTLPVRIRIVLSAWISNHEPGNVASRFPLSAAASTDVSKKPLRTRPNPTISAPPVFTNCLRVSVAPKMLTDFSGMDILLTSLRHNACGTLHRVDDRGVAAAAAQMRRRPAHESLFDLRDAWRGVFIQGFRRFYHYSFFA